MITLRDKDSAALLEQIGIDISEKVHVTADPVFSLEWKEEGAEEKYVCMALRHWFDIIPFIPVRICNQFNIRSAKNKVRYEQYIETMAGTTAYINNELGYPVVFVSFLCGRDDKVARDIMERVTLMGDKSSQEPEETAGQRIAVQQETATNCWQGKTSHREMLSV